ncbi:PIG-L family deacetylase [Alphaproteobacteria bacterium]|nr:PIG-L family deacetylase [Alphaproteobacteria bacterium]MDC1120360.1 PIG-L family deacetylase [Alphaproteobacteria bacterium]
MISDKDRVLVVAAHPDDEVLGMGGTLLKHYRDGDEISVIFMSDGVTGRDVKYDPQKRAEEIQSRKEMALVASTFYGSQNLSFLDLPNLRMDKEYILDVTKQIERHIAEFDPTIVYTHFGSDTNIDHGITNKACVVALRPTPDRKVASLRLFEVCSSTEYSPMMFGDDFVPNLYIDITDFSEKKLSLLECYSFEMRQSPHPRSLDSIVARDIYRGSSVGLHRAEAFIEIRRIIF